MKNKDRYNSSELTVKKDKLFGVPNVSEKAVGRPKKG